MSTLGNNLFAAYYAQQGLPYGYRRVEYLGSAGTQYIDTNFSFSGNILECDLIAEGVVQQNEHNIIGTNINGRNNFICGVYNSKWFLYTRALSYYPSDGNIDGGYVIANTMQSLKIILDKNNTKRTFIVNESQYNSDIYNHTDDASNAISVFSGGGTYKAGKYKIKEVKIKQDTLLTRNYIPCVRLSDSKPGLYDLCGSICPLTNTPFYINAGTGEFVIPT